MSAVRWPLSVRSPFTRSGVLTFIVSLMCVGPEGNVRAQDSRPAASASGWYGPEYQRCAENSTEEIIECVERKAAGWDRRLQIAYDRLMQRQAPEQRERLRFAQRLWIQYRDGNCAFYDGGEGSIRRIARAECRRSMTQSRAVELEDAAKG